MPIGRVSFITTSFASMQAAIRFHLGALIVLAIGHCHEISLRRAGPKPPRTMMSDADDGRHARSCCHCRAARLSATTSRCARFIVIEPRMRSSDIISLVGNDGRDDRNAMQPPDKSGYRPARSSWAAASHTFNTSGDARPGFICKNFLTYRAE